MSDVAWHLAHPALVHVTIAFLLVGGAAEAWGIATRRAAWESFGGIAVLIGTASLVPTVVSGYLAANTVPLPPGGAALLDVHERYALIAGAIFLMALLWRGWGGGRIPDGQRGAYALLLASGVILVGVVAFLGGRLVYGAGVGVLR